MEKIMIRAGALLCLVSSLVYASPAQLKEGNRLFKNGNYEKALKLYEDALVDTPHSSLLKYNAGDAAYQAGDFSKAAHYFQEADQSTLPGLTNAARYNLGNALFRQDNRPEAIEAYKNALRTNPADEDARYNLSVAMRQNNGKSKSPPKKGSGDQKKNKGSDGQQPQDAQAPKPGQMSREDAERLLDAASAGEMKKAQRQQKQENAKTDEDW